MRGRFRRWVGFSGLALAFTLAHIAFPAPQPDGTGWVTVGHRLVTLALVVATLVAAHGAGTRLLRILGPASFDSFESAWLGTLAGLAGLAYAMLALGLLGLLRPPIILAVVFTIGLIAWPDMGGTTDTLRRATTWAKHEWTESTAMVRGLMVLCALVVLAAFLKALAPTSGYDALSYHLEGPRLFLQEGRIYPSATRWLLNLPLTPEMLNLIGLAWGSRDYGQMLEFMWAGLLVWGVWGLAAGWIGRRVAWLAVAVILSTPVLPVWATTANSDFARASLLLAGLACSVRSSTETGLRRLLLAGLFTGFALGAKPQSAAGLAAYVLLLLTRRSRTGLRRATRDVALFAFVAIVVASPWYVKNWIWFDDPLFPLAGGGVKIDPTRMALQEQYAATYPTPKSIVEWLLLPWDLYSHPEKYSEIFPAWGFPSPLFALLLFYPLVPRVGPLDRSLPTTLIHGLIISAASPVMRWLLPVFPIMAISCAYVLEAIPTVRPSLVLLQRPLMVLLGLLLAVGLAFQASIALADRVVPVLLGRESEASYLARVIPTYAAVRHARAALPAGSRLLTTGDMRTYYCENACLDSDYQFLWQALVEKSRSPTEFAQAAADLGITHVMISWQDLAFFIAHGPMPGSREAAQVLIERFLPECGRKVYADPNAEIYALSCGGVGG